MKRVKFKLPWFFEAEWGSANIDRNDQTIAWELYCELGTRVGVVEFNPEEDIIINCIKSWYTFFNLTRKSLKNLRPPKKPSIFSRLFTFFKKDESEILSNIIIKLLNDQFRPFLRYWYPQFEFYWENEAEEKINPIERQKRFPKYEEIVEEISKLQTKLKQTAEALFKIATS